MKNQYVGDINDYRKYGLLRKLCGGDTAAAVCWMLTPDDGGPDGRKTLYLKHPNKWRNYDPNLFDALTRVVSEGNRCVDCVENANILPLSSFSFYKQALNDDIAMRERYFQGFLSIAHDKDLVFFDPDNGLDVPSKPRGRKGSSKYLYRDELWETWKTETSILIYQHFPMEDRVGFINRIAQELRSRMEVPEVVSLRTPHVVFFLLAKPRHQRLLDRAKGIGEAWGAQIRVRYIARQEKEQ